KDGKSELGMFRAYWTRASGAIATARADAGERMGSTRQSLDEAVHSALESAEELARVTRRTRRAGFAEWPRGYAHSDDRSPSGRPRRRSRAPDCGTRRALPASDRAGPDRRCRPPRAGSRDPPDRTRQHGRTPRLLATSPPD